MQFSNSAGHSDRTIQVLLGLIVILLAVIAFKPGVSPTPVFAQSANSDFYIEPRTQMLRKPDGTAQLIGKVIIDRRTGDIWGFPTLTEAPYPIDVSNTKPPVSEPMYLGKFDFSKMRR